MTELKIFKIDEEFKDTDGLYRYLFENVDLISELTEIQIQKPLKQSLFCLVGKEQITGKNIIFFAAKSKFPECLGELIILCGALNIDIIVLFMKDVNKVYLEPLNWFQGICNPNVQIIIAEVQF